jgi:hypothetical protein
MRLVCLFLVMIISSLQTVSAAVKWNNSSSSKVEEKDAQSVKSCKHLGKVETSKNAGAGFSYNLKAAKEKLAGKASKLGGDTFVLADGWDSGQRRTVTFEADVYKCD